MAGQLVESGYRLIAPSRFGYLRSDFPDHATPEMQADAFAGLLDKLKLERVSVFDALRRQGMKGKFRK